MTKVISVDNQPPSVPENLENGTIQSNIYQITWDASTDDVGVQGYHIYRNGSYLTDSISNSYSDTSVNPTTEYTYRVSAYDAAENESDLSAPTTGMTLEIDNEPPTLPSNLHATDVQSYRVSLSWDASSDNTAVTGYRVYRGGSAIGTSNGTGYTDTTVQAGKTYVYSIAAYDAVGNYSGQSGSIEVTTPASSADSTIMDHYCADVSLIPDIWIETAKSTLHIAYQHTSHGSQIPSGMDTLAAYPDYGDRYQWSEDGTEGLDLDKYDPIMDGYHDLSTEDSEDEFGNTPWANATRTFLDNTSNYHINVVMWSWCSISGHDIDRYITNMERLISEYGEGGTNSRALEHPVEFVFMTGHTTGSGEEGSVPGAAAKIREHCVSNNRWLIDYYDIECYDPDGNYFGDKYVTDNLVYDSGNWAVEYLERHDGEILDILTTGQGVDGFSGCTYCAHSDEDYGYSESTLNCVLKGQVAWHLFARIAGWDGNP